MPILLFLALTLFSPLSWPERHPTHECQIYTDQASLTKAWVRDGGDPAKVPVVDWNKHIVVAAFAGQKPSAGYQIKISTVAIQAGENKFWDLYVIYKETEPTGMAAQVISYPSHVTRVSRVNTTGKVYFLKEGSQEASQIRARLKPR